MSCQTGFTTPYLNYRAKNSEISDMGTTLVMGLVTQVSIWIACVGDSAVFRVSSSGVKQLTPDPGLLEEAFEQGMSGMQYGIEEEHIAPMPSDQSQHLGAGLFPDIQITEESIAPGETYLFCTDGLMGNTMRSLVSEKEISGNILNCNDRRNTLKNLADIAYQRGSRDNITAVLLALAD